MAILTTSAEHLPASRRYQALRWPTVTRGDPGGASLPLGGIAVDVVIMKALFGLESGA
ncbi:hypothetical protein J2Y68_000550 [Paenarthrobacter nitroguajacolicus]|nr:hypothetical protein [Paenarthrobacter nitroguajacolicus]